MTSASRPAAASASFSARVVGLGSLDGLFPIALLDILVFLIRRKLLTLAPVGPVLGALAGSAFVLAALAASLRPARLGKVAQELAGDGRGLAGHAHPRSAQHLLGFGGVSDRGREQGDRQAAVLLARSGDEAAGVAAMSAAGGVDEQSEQALGLRPALHRVLLVELAGAFGQSPHPGLRLVAAADAALGERLQQDLGARAALLARPSRDDVDGVVECIGFLQDRDLGERLQPQLVVAVALDAGEEETATELLGLIVLY